MTEDPDHPPDPGAALRARFRDRERGVPTGRWSRLWRTSRAAAGLGRAVLGGSWRDRDGGLDPADLDAIATLAERLAELKGVGMKIGQILGYIDPTLPPELRALLSVLHTQAPASPWATVEATLRVELGPRADALLAGLDPTPVAVASIGQVHRGRLPDGREVAVKIQHPGITDALRGDFGNAAIGAAIARLLPGGRGVRGLIDEARAAMLDECDYGLEAARQRRFARWYAAHPVLAIPEVIDAWCTPRVLTTTWMPGRGLADVVAARPSQTVRDRIGGALFELFVGTLYRYATFHADPHPGNFAVLADGRVVIYDFGCVRSFEPALVRALARLLAAVRAGDAVTIAAGVAALGGRPPTRPRDRARLHALLRGFFAPLLEPGRHAIAPGAALAGADLVRDKRALLGLELPGHLLFLLRLRFGLYAVLAELGAVIDWAALESRWAAATGTGTLAIGSAPT